MSSFSKKWTYWPAILAPVIAIVLTLWRLPTTFNITARTESLSLITTNDHRSTWQLENVKVFKGFSRKGSSFTGNVKVLPGAEVSFERIASGPFRIRCWTIDPTAVVAKLNDAGTGSTEDVRERLVIRIDNLADRAARGESIVVSVTGKIEIGSSIGFDSGTRTALLRGGKISLLGHSLFNRSRFDGGTFSLDTGDYITIEDGRSSSGIVVVNEEPALTAVVRAVGNRSKVSRFASQGYQITISLLTRIRNDGSLQAAWATTLFILGLAGYLKKRGKGGTK